ncbi:hypothetical protein [Virgibacillus sp. SK37]|uniref:hypothetical protein n=1 Tax=Virgibacillus sp. SK37 TaxID=403957 RepID=UPI0004D0CB46|nr:hypothetical protein [Virgibacillus sp. SK37]AIF45643.1 hypothetical protein X953_18805 [Virgibacillus sp. SK37]
MKNFGDLVQAGKNYIEDIEIDFNKEKYSIPVRPLSKDENARIQKLQSKGQKTRGVLNQENPEKSSMEIEIDNAASAQYNAEAEILAVSLCIADGEKHTIEEVKNLPSGVVSQIAKAIYRISGIAVKKEDKEALKEELNSFRND